MWWFYWVSNRWRLQENNDSEAQKVTWWERHHTLHSQSDGPPLSGDDAAAVPCCRGRKHQSCPTAWDTRGAERNRGGREWAVDGGGTYTLDQNIKYHLILLCRANKNTRDLQDYFKRYITLASEAKGWNHFLWWKSTLNFSQVFKFSAYCGDHGQ